MASVRAWVAAAEPATASTARTLMRATARLAMWAWREIASVDVAVVLHPHNVEHFIAYVCAGERRGWRQGARWALTRVGRAANPSGWAPVPPKIGRGTRPEPYSAEVEHAFVVAATLPGRANRTARMWVASAALGAGLVGPEIADVTTDDITDLSGGRLGVRVRGRHPRLVPLRGAYTRIAREVIEATSPAAKLLTNESRYAAYRVAQQISAAGESLSMRRARNTWLAAHLRAGTPLWALRRVAGTVSADTVDALSRHEAVDGCDADAVSEALRA